MKYLVFFLLIFVLSLFIMPIEQVDARPIEPATNWTVWRQVYFIYINNCLSVESFSCEKASSSLNWFWSLGNEKPRQTPSHKSRRNLEKYYNLFR